MHQPPRLPPVTGRFDGREIAGFESETAVPQARLAGSKDSWRSKPCLPQAGEETRFLCVCVTQHADALGHLRATSPPFAELKQILEQSDSGIIVSRPLRGDKRLDSTPRLGLPLR